MTKTIDYEKTPTLTSKLWLGLQLLLAVPVFVISLGVLLGIIVVTIRESSVGGRDIALIILMLSVVGASGFWLSKLISFRFSDEPLAPSAKRAKLFMGISVSLGVLIGLGFAILGDSPGGSSDLFSNGPVDPKLAIGLTAIYLVGVPLVGWFWHKSIDEHEAKANEQGALLGIYSYSMIAPAWWMGWRAGLLPPQEPMIVFAVVMSVWGLVWAIRRNA